MGSRSRDRLRRQRDHPAERVNLLREWLAEYRTHPVPAAILAGIAALALVLGVTVFVVRHTDSAFPGKAGGSIKSAASTQTPTVPTAATPTSAQPPTPTPSSAPPPANGSARIPGVPVVPPATVTATTMPSSFTPTSLPPPPSPPVPSPPTPEPSFTPTFMSSATSSPPPPPPSSPPSSPSGVTLLPGSPP